MMENLSEIFLISHAMFPQVCARKRIFLRENLIIFSLAVCVRPGNICPIHVKCVAQSFPTNAKTLPRRFCMPRSSLNGLHSELSRFLAWNIGCNLLLCFSWSGQVPNGVSIPECVGVNVACDRGHLLRVSSAGFFFL